MARKPAKGPGGRPTAYRPEMCDIVIECGDEGKTLAEMARALDVDRSTINDWRERHPEFSRAIKAGLDRAQAWWEDKGRVATFGGVDGFNATSYIFQMKNRFREDWNDRQAIEHSGTVQHENTVSDDLQQALDAIAGKLAGGTGADEVAGDSKANTGRAPR